MPEALKSFKIRALAYYAYCRGRLRTMQMHLCLEVIKMIRMGLWVISWRTLEGEETVLGLGGGGDICWCVTEGVFYTLYTPSSNREFSTQRLPEFLCCRMIWVPPTPFPMRKTPPLSVFLLPVYIVRLNSLAALRGGDGWPQIIRQHRNSGTLNTILTLFPTVLLTISWEGQRRRHLNFSLILSV